MWGEKLAEVVMDRFKLDREDVVAIDLEPKDIPMVLRIFWACGHRLCSQCLADLEGVWRQHTLSKL